MKQTSFRPCATCPIPSITTCNAGGLMNNKGKACKVSLTAMKKENLKTDFEKSGCPYNN